MITTNCATGALAPYVPDADTPWNKKRIMHLYRRMGFGATPEEVDAALTWSPAELVDSLVDEALALPLAEEPEWGYWTLSDYDDFNTQQTEQIIEWVVKWTNDMIANGFREKLTLFWHNHFVTRFETYLCPSHMYQYHKVLQQNALGNFKTFTKEIGITPAMLVFLNGVQNTRTEPNENYARELYELFTLGQDNGYTQSDIVETARALTGWNGYLNPCDAISFVPFFHDTGVKTIFGQTGNWNYDDVHDILFDQRADELATHICTKIYRFFVHPDEVNPDIVAGLADTFKNNNFELAPVFRQLFKSEHFFDDYVIGTQVKSPTDFFMNFIREGGFEYNDEVMEIITYFIFQLGQTLFSPVDVAGWPGNRAWVTNNTLTGRWQSMDLYVFFMFENHPQVLVDFAKSLTDEHNNAALITQLIVDHFIPNGLNDPEAYDRAFAVLRWEIPQNYFDNDAWDLNWETAPIQLALLLQHITRLPEFQLF